MLFGYDVYSLIDYFIGKFLKKGIENFPGVQLRGMLKISKDGKGHEDKK